MSEERKIRLLNLKRQIDLALAIEDIGYETIIDFKLSDYECEKNIG